MKTKKVPGTKKPLEQEAFLSLQRAAGALMAEVEQLLKGREISPAQYNVLRILRGAEPAGLPCSEIAGRMITRDPDITRLVDRLETQKWVQRARIDIDRRVIRVKITEKGLEILAALDQPVARLHRSQIGHLGEKKLHSLMTLLELAAGAAARRLK